MQIKNNTSFTGRMLIKGYGHDINKLTEIIYTEALEKGVPIQARVHKTGFWTTMLYTTKRDAAALTNYLAKEYESPEAGFKSKAGFYRDSFHKYIKLPQKTYTTKEVIKAMQEGLFDFANLLIQKKP